MLSYIVISQKFKLKLISAKFLLPMISRNELSTTLSALWSYPGVRVTAAESLIRDLGRVCEGCDLSVMKLNARKTKTMMVSKSRTMYPQSPLFNIGGTVLKESDDLFILGSKMIDSKMTFEKHLRSVSRAASQKFGILGSPGECSMIDRFLGDAFGVLSCPF